MKSSAGLSTERKATGVYLFDVTSRSAIETVTPESERVRLEANAQAYIIERANQALVDAVEITDNRVKFF